MLLMHAFPQLIPQFSAHPPASCFSSLLTQNRALHLLTVPHILLTRAVVSMQWVDAEAGEVATLLADPEFAGTVWVHLSSPSASDSRDSLPVACVPVIVSSSLAGEAWQGPLQGQQSALAAPVGQPADARLCCCWSQVCGHRCRHRQR